MFSRVTNTFHQNHYVCPGLLLNFVFGRKIICARGLHSLNCNPRGVSFRSVFKLTWSCSCCRLPYSKVKNKSNNAERVELQDLFYNLRHCSKVIIKWFSASCGHVCTYCITRQQFSRTKSFQIRKFTNPTHPRTYTKARKLPRREICKLDSLVERCMHVHHPVAAGHSVRCSPLVTK